jgi:hypothetical protein
MSDLKLSRFDKLVGGELYKLLATNYNIIIVDTPNSNINGKLVEVLTNCLFGVHYNEWACNIIHNKDPKYVAKLLLNKVDTKITQYINHTDDIAISTESKDYEIQNANYTLYLYSSGFGKILFTLEGTKYITYTLRFANE